MIDLTLQKFENYQLFINNLEFYMEHNLYTY